MPAENESDGAPVAKQNDLQPAETAANRFREQVGSQTSNLDDHDPEEEMWSGGYSPKAMIGTWILMAALSVVLLIVAIAVPPVTIPIAIGLIIVMWVFGGLRYAWRRLGVHYQLTSQRFIHQTGILTRKTDRIEVIDIDDVSFAQGPIERMFGVGSILLTGSDRTHPTLSMVGIDNVKDVSGLIDDVRRKERRQRSLHIEAI